ncbi:MAG: hypothetical protein AABY22_05950, partial [Nanoarchaeota archaeon]
QRTEIFIDSVNVQNLDNGEIDLGNQEIEIKTTIDGITPTDFDKVEGTMTAPSGQKITLSFRKITVGVYKTTYNFDEAATNYRMRYSLLSFATGDTIDDEITFITTGAPTSDQKLKSTTLQILLFVGIGVIVIIAIIIVVLVLKGRRR